MKNEKPKTKDTPAEFMNAGPNAYKKAGSPPHYFPKNMADRLKKKKLEMIILSMKLSEIHEKLKS